MDKHISVGVFALGEICYVKVVRYTDLYKEGKLAMLIDNPPEGNDQRNFEDFLRLWVRRAIRHSKEDR